MATHKSAEKRHRQSLKRRERNRRAQSALSTAMKKVDTLVQNKGDKKEIAEAVRYATRLIDKSVVHRQMHRNKASRQISQLAKRASAAR